MCPEMDDDYIPPDDHDDDASSSLCPQPEDADALLMESLRNLESGNHNEGEDPEGETQLCLYRKPVGLRERRDAPETKR